MDKITICQTLGRVHAIGDLYDARRDQFCHFNIFNSELPPSAIRVNDNQQVSASYSMSNRLSEKFDSLDISGQLRVSILSNIVQLSGSGQYLSDEKLSKRAVRASLIYNVKTMSESLTMIYEKKLKSMINTEAALHKPATHVVVGIQWGANAILSVEHSNSCNINEKEVQSKLKSLIEILYSGISAGGKVEFNKVDLKTTEDCIFRIFADLQPKKPLSQTLEGYMNIVNKFPELLKDSNNGKGKPISYVMVPITMLMKYFGVETTTDDLVQDIEPQTIISIENLLDDVSMVKQEVSDLYDDIENWIEHCGQSTFNRISEIKSKLSVSEANFRIGLAKALVQFRSREAEASVFQDLISRFHEEEYSVDKVPKMLKEFDPVIEKAQFVESLKTKGVHYIGKPQLMDTLFLNFQEQNIYILNYSMRAIKSNEDLWKRNIRAFLAILDDIHDENGPVFVFKENLQDDEGLPIEALSISCYINGSCISKDLLADSEKIANLSLARSDNVDPLNDKPNKRKFLEIKCPGAFVNICKNVNLKWQCSKCFYILEYGFNGSVYCECGGAAISSLTFKCDDSNHGFTFFKFENEEILTKLVADLTI